MNANTISRVLSRVFSPLLMPTYGMALALWATPLNHAPESARMHLTIIVFLATCIVPAALIVALMRLHVVSDPSITERRQRYIPMGLMVLCFLFSAWFAHRAYAPLWLVMFLLGGSLCSLLALCITLRYKVSLHAMGAGALCALTVALGMSHLVSLPLLWSSLAFGIAGALGTARLWLHYHTIGQVALGFAMGLIIELAASLPFMNLPG